MGATWHVRPLRREYRVSPVFWIVSGALLIYFLVVLLFLNALRKSALQDHQSFTIRNSPPLTAPQNYGPDFVYQHLLSAGVSEQFLQLHRSKLPSWSTIVDQYGAEPVIFGLPDACDRYQESVAPKDRILAAAGMFSTGTNLLTKLLKHNCFIPARMTLYGMNATKEQLGIRWQVPWGKHTPESYKSQHSATDRAAAIPKEHIFPIVTIRNPWRWMQSMCKNPYSARWSHFSQCPNILNGASDDPNRKDANERHNAVSVTYDAGVEVYRSLPHLWNDWYDAYYRKASQNASGKSDLSYPLLIVRMEDLVFHTYSTIRTVCRCAGGELYSEQNFTYIISSAKADSPGHDTTTGMAEAYWKYGQPLPPGAGFDSTDYFAALELLDPHLMNLFHYQHPPPFT